MLDVQTKLEIDGIASTPKSCGCGGNATVNIRQSTAQQSSVLDAIQRVNKRRNAIYKTKTPFFI